MTTTTYAKTKAGEWVAKGPVAIIIEGQVTVTKRDGSSKTETIVRVGKAWTQDGEQIRYGYLAPTSTAPTSAPRTNADDGTHTCRMCRCHTDRPNRSILFDGCAGCGCDQDW